MGMRATIPLLLLAFLSGCDGCDPGSDDGDTATDGDRTDLGERDGSTARDFGPRPDLEAFDAGGCEPPQLFIVLDRTMSMHRTADGSDPEDTAAGRLLTKWGVAVGAIETMTSELGDTIDFGLELFPVDEPGTCVTLSERIGGMTATNSRCEPGEVVVSPTAGAGGAIDAALDVDTAQLCRSTPIGAGLATARDHLATIEDGRDQLVLLVTDGGDTCAPDDGPDPAAIAGELRAMGVDTFVVGFGAGIRPAVLNGAACAGGRAPAGSCMAGPDGYDVPVDPEGDALYLDASNDAALTAALESIAGDICCGCLL